MLDTGAMLPNQTTERDLFRTMGLEWIRKSQREHASPVIYMLILDHSASAPTMRNADP